LTSADPADQSVGGGRGDQVLHRPPAPLRGDHERAVLDERAGVDQVGHVLASRAPTTLPTAGDGVGPVVVEAELVALDHFAEVVAFESERPGRRTGRRTALVGGAGAFVDVQQRLPDGDRVAVGDRHRLDDPVDRRDDLVVHLHRLDEGHHLTGAYEAPASTRSPTIVPCNCAVTATAMPLSLAAGRLSSFPRATVGTS
jgi:hypothetical protein